jgi:Flp pilus assembly protein TadG
MELLLVFPILLTVLLATVEFSTFAVARQQLLTASREGARVAAVGGTRDEVEAAVRLFLGGGRFTNAQIDTVLTDVAGDPVEVTVRIQATDAVPDLLPLAGFSISNQTIAASTVLRRE